MEALQGHDVAKLATAQKLYSWTHKLVSLFLVIAALI